MDNTLIWLILAIILFIIEAATVGMICLWFGIGAVASMLISLATDNIYIQWVIFIIVSVAALVMFRPIAKAAVTKAKTKTNSDALVGQTAFLTEAINENQCGRLKIGDISWLAESENNQQIEKGSKVKILYITGNKLVVQKI